jgi:hypothetical protein
MNVKTTLLTGSCLLSLLASGIVRAEEVDSELRSIAVRYRNGDIEHYLVAWTADLGVDLREDGAVAQPGVGRFVDDRRCHWSVSGSITRQVFLLDHAGDQYGSAELVRVYGKAKRDQGTAFVVTTLTSDNCGAATARRDGDYVDVKRRLLDDFPGTVEADLVALRQELKARPDVTRVLAGPDFRPAVRVTKTADNSR